MAENRKKKENKMKEANVGMMNQTMYRNGKTHVAQYEGR